MLVHLSYIFLLYLSLMLPIHAQQYHYSEGGFLSFGARSIEAYFFNGAEKELLIIDEGDGKAHYGSLRKAMQASNCNAGINGSFFAANAKRSPLGLVRSNGKSINPFAKNTFTVAGILYDTGSEIKLERSGELSTPIAEIRQAIQAGPFLIENGQAIPKLNQVKNARRSFIASNGKGRWCIGISSSMTLAGLSEFLLKKGVLGNFKVTTALNLDGGGSSSFWVKTGKIYYSSYKTVRNYVGIQSRKPSKPSNENEDCLEKDSSPKKQSD